MQRNERVIKPVYGPADLVTGLMFSYEVKLLPVSQLSDAISRKQKEVNIPLPVEPLMDERKIKEAMKKLSVKYHPREIDTAAIIGTPNNNSRILAKAEAKANWEHKAEADNEMPMKDPTEYLGRGKMLSADYRAKIDNWSEKYRGLTIKDNFKQNVSDIMRNILQKEKIPSLSSNNNNASAYYCDICQRNFSSKTTHDCEMTGTYTTILSSKVPKLGEIMANIVGSETWQWKPAKLAQKPEYLVKFEEISGNIKTDLNEFRSLQPLFGEQTDEEMLFHFVKTENEDIKAIAVQVCIIDVKSLETPSRHAEDVRSALEANAQVRLQTSSIFKKETDQRQAVGSAPIIPHVNGFIDREKLPTVNIQAPPQWLTDSLRTFCAICRATFKFTKRRHHCRVCGDIFCSSCLIKAKVPKYGYLIPVKICRACHHKMFLEDSLLWVEHASILASRGFDEDASRSLFVSTCYNADRAQINTKIMEAGDNFYNQGKYDLALKSYYLSSADFDRWMTLAHEFCEKGNFSLAFTCIRSAKALFKKTTNQMITFGDSYSEAALQPALLQRKGKDLVNEVLALFCYLEGDLKIQDIITKAVKNEKFEANDQSSLYLAYANVKKIPPDDWLRLGQAMMNAQCYKTALYCYYQANYDVQKWMEVIESLYNATPARYEVALRLLTAIDLVYKPHWDDLRVSCDLALYYSWVKSASKKISFDSLLERYVELVELKSPNSKLVLCMMMALTFGKLSKYDEECQNYLSKKDFKKASICFGLARVLQEKGQSWIEFGESMLDSDSDSAFLCFTMDSPDWTKLGDYMFDKKRYTTALNCYVRSGEGETYRRILGCARELVKMENVKQALLYYTQLHKDGKFIVDTALDLCHISQQGTNRDILIATVQKTGKDYSDKELTMIHQMMSTILKQENVPEGVIGALHYSAKYHQESHEEFMNLQKEKAAKELEGFHQVVKDAINASKPIELVKLLTGLDLGKVEIVKKLYKDQVRDQDIAEVPAHNKCFMYLLRASINVYEDKITLALVDLETALICYPIDGVPEAVAMMLQNEKMQIQAHKGLVTELNSIIDSDFKELNLFCNTSVPKHYHFQGVLKGTKLLTSIRKFEKAVSAQTRESIDAALLYLDLCGTIEDPSGVVGCLIMAGLHFLKAQKQATNGGRVYAYRNAVVEVMMSAYITSIQNLTPSIQVYVNKIALVGILKANQTLAKFNGGSQGGYNHENVIDKLNKQLIEGLVSNIVGKSKISPISNLPTAHACDMVFLDLACRSYTQTYLDRLKAKGTPLCPVYLSDYYLFEGAVKRWYTSDPDFEQLRSNAMKSLIQMKGWRLTDVQNLMRWASMPRTHDGWINAYHTSLNFTKKAFKKVAGVRINTETGALSLLLQEAFGNDALFTTADIHQVLTSGIKGAFFTLDHPDTSLPLHPFQEIKYYPKEISGTDYLSTMLHADYLLKMISTGVEVSTTAPFSMKKASAGFMKVLPGGLQDALKPISERANQKVVASESTHRVWIEAGTLSYDIKKNGSEISYLLGDVKMKVRKQLVKYGAYGEVVEVPDEANDMSAEADFVRAFTNNYDQVGKYFPVLLRLKELVKLSGLCVILQRLYQDVKDVIKSKRANTHEIYPALEKIKRKVSSYPKATSTNIDNAFREALKSNGIHNEHNVDWSTRNRIKNEIKAKLEEADRKVLDEVTKAFAGAFHASTGSIRSYVDSWLKGNRSDMLLITLANAENEFDKSKYLNIVREIESLGIKTVSDSNVQIENSRGCSWVPATFCFDDEAIRKRKIYGGISLGLNMTKADVGTQPFKVFIAKEVIKK